MRKGRRKARKARLSAEAARALQAASRRARSTSLKAEYQDVEARLEVVRRLYPHKTPGVQKRIARRARIMALEKARTFRDLENAYHYSAVTRKWYPLDKHGIPTRRGGLTVGQFSRLRKVKAYWSLVRGVRDATGASTKAAREVVGRQLDFERAYARALKRTPGLKRKDFRRKHGRDPGLEALEDLGVFEDGDSSPYEGA